VFLDSKVLHVATAEDNIFVDLVGRSDLDLGPTSPALGAEGPDILEGNCRFFRVDLVKHTDITASRQRDGIVVARMECAYRISLLEMSEILDLKKQVSVCLEAAVGPALQYPRNSDIQLEDGSDEPAPS
jgi:hypothetical protein